jgi:hypothetical protein
VGFVIQPLSSRNSNLDDRSKRTSLNYAVCLVAVRKHNTRACPINNVAKQNLGEILYRLSIIAKFVKDTDVPLCFVRPRGTAEAVVLGKATSEAGEA